MQKILILTTATGEGHNQAAKSLRDILKTEYSEVEIFDFLKKTKAVNDLIVGGYELSAKIFPYVYGFFYALTDFKSINRLAELFLNSPIEKTLDYINEFKPDVIACTHPLAVSILGYLSRKKLIDIPTISIITDFKPHYTYYSNEISAYITGSEFTKQELIKFGVSSNKIYPVGIPISKSFYENSTKQYENNNFCKILVMGGSMGLSGISKVIEQLTINSNKLEITLVCGRNETLKNTLNLKYKEFSNLKILGFVTNIPTLMDEMDLIITKPGGLTTTESINKGLPMIIPFVIPGQETDNSKLLVNEGAAIRVKNISNINNVLNDLIENPYKLKSLKNNMIRLSENYSVNQTIQIFKNFTKNNPTK
ncbi:MAG: MGDG synthase family glycosyltransferase [Sarcina sp.]